MEIYVTNETNTSTKTYRVHVEVPHSSKMKYLNLTSSAGTNIQYEIVDGKTNYNLDLESYIAAVYAKATLYDSEATATITGDMDQGFVVKNFHEPEVPPPTPIPQTGENTKLIIGSSMIIIAGIACYSLISLKKKQLIKF